MSLLSPDDLAYMRETQAGTRPTAAELFALLESAPDGMGGHGHTYTAADDGQPISIRVWKVQDNTASGGVPQDLAARYAVADLRKVVTDLVATKPGDLIHDMETDRWLEVVTYGEAEEWTTAQIVWATPTGKRPPA